MNEEGRERITSDLIRSVSYLEDCLESDGGRDEGDGRKVDRLGYGVEGGRGWILKR